MYTYIHIYIYVHMYTDMCRAWDIPPTGEKHVENYMETGLFRASRDDVV